ncbi:MAG: hypothetical protein ACYC66_13340 [Chloroflexota bacterium]
MASQRLEACGVVQFRNGPGLFLSLLVDVDLSGHYRFLLRLDLLRAHADRMLRSLGFTVSSST